MALDTGKGYQITADISTATEAMLAGAGTTYPAEIIATYLSTDGVTQRTADLARQVVEAAGATDPYHQARALADYLRTDPRFSYSTVAALPSEPGRDLVDFFLFDPNGQVGYCEYYASAMAVMARAAWPAVARGGRLRARRADRGRHLLGPGTQRARLDRDLLPRLRVGDLRGHPLDRSRPTPARRGDRPAGHGAGRGRRPRARVSRARTSATSSTLPSFQPLPGGFQPGGQRPNDETRTGNATVVIVLLALLVALAVWRLLRSRYRFRFLAPGDQQWQRLAFAADRAGVAQRPSETVYEYASWLEEQLPRRSVEIHQIADGKVWESYSGRWISSEVIARLERAWGGCSCRCCGWRCAAAFDRCSVAAGGP